MWQSLASHDGSTRLWGRVCPFLHCYTHTHTHISISMGSRLALACPINLLSLLMTSQKIEAVENSIAPVTSILRLLVAQLVPPVDKVSFSGRFLQ